ncbi:LOW QUALITY PROTEIN: hypothetical protein HID58_017792 [Brassica napus]|uniref:Uncharacterized protein n=1 Tax=Brassica napus TaxID=3708 RepID=A0ABQ8DAW9_BRANA|nr:LOW QUALITY PROTEIN: hypothetical protein HID58_017792 [Brassica napus]
MCTITARWDVKAVGDLLDRECVRPDVILAEGEEDSDDEDDDTVLLQWDKNEDDIVADVESGGIVAEEELQLLNKPNHVSTPEEAENQCGKAGCGQVLHEPFLKFLKHEEEDESEISQDMERLALEYYDPKPGEFVVGVVTCVADMLGTIMTNEKYVAEEFLVHGKIGIVKDDDEDVCKARHACGGDRTLSGRSLLSSRRYFRRIAWHQVRTVTGLERFYIVEEKSKARALFLLTCSKLFGFTDGSMIRQNVIRLKSFRDNKELFSRLTNSRYKPNIASFCKDVLKTG